MRRFFRHLRFTKRWYWLVFSLVPAFVLSYFMPWLFDLLVVVTAGLFAATVTDAWLLFRHAEPVSCARRTEFRRLSNGDVNDVALEVTSFYGFDVTAEIIDELPVQLQVRDFMIAATLKAGHRHAFRYQVRPVERGEYHFGVVNLFLASPARLVQRHIRGAEPEVLACYPSFIRLRQYQLLAVSNRLSELSGRKIRRIGQSMEFEQVEEYSRGNDIRKMNWKASARMNKLMVNHYTEERAQQVYCLIDMGRAMKMPFGGLTLLDHAINSSLVLGHVAWIRQDKPGLVGFAERVVFSLNASRKGNQLLQFQEKLYNASTGFRESGFDRLLSYVQVNIHQRSLLLLFTNFESLSALRRQLKYLRRLAARHLLVVVFFENTELARFTEEPAGDLIRVYEQTIAEKFRYEKRLITRELRQYGILSLYTPPEELTVNTLNKYIEIKARGLI